MMDGKPTSTPTISHVIAYDLQIRKKQAEFMNASHDFKSALEAARNPDKEGREIRQVHFLSPVAISIASPECRACTAPGIRETFGHGFRGSASSGRADEDSGIGQISKKAIKKIKQNAKAAAEKDAKQKYALMNGGVGDGQSKRAKKGANQQAYQQNRNTLALQNGGVGDGAINLSRDWAKGKGKGKTKSDDRHEGVPICYNYNRGVPCKNTPCGFAHVCLVCKKRPSKERLRMCAGRSVSPSLRGGRDRRGDAPVAG